MELAIDQLIKSIAQVRQCSRLTIDLDETGPPEQWADHASLSESEFMEFTGYGCDAAQSELLALPDRVRISWQGHSHIAGGISLSNPISTLDRKLDPAFLLPGFTQFQLIDYRIVDAYFSPGGAYHVLAKLTPTALDGKLYLLDSDVIEPLRLSANEYLRRTAVTKGIANWPYLYLKQPRLSGFGKSVLKKGIDFLQREFSDWDYTELLQLWDRSTR